MKRQFGLSALFGFAVSTLLGTVLHFLYYWLKEAKWIAPFSGVNESTWEHMKLLFWPMLLYAAIQSLFFRDREDFWCVKLRGILLGLAIIPIAFYTYNGAVGKSSAFINISIFFVAAAIAYLYEAKAFKSGRVKCKNKRLAILLLIAVALLFVVFTFRTPEIAIFKDPISGKYGI